MHINKLKKKTILKQHIYLLVKLTFLCQLCSGNSINFRTDIFKKARAHTQTHTHIHTYILKSCRMPIDYVGTSDPAWLILWLLMTRRCKEPDQSHQSTNSPGIFWYQTQKIPDIMNVMYNVVGRDLISLVNRHPMAFDQIIYSSDISKPIVINECVYFDSNFIELCPRGANCR